MKKKKEEPKGLDKRDVGPEGRKMADLPTQVEKPEGEAGVGRGRGRSVWLCGVEGHGRGFRVRRSSGTAQMSHSELSKLLEVPVAKD